MAGLRLYQVTAAGPRELPLLPEEADRTVHDLLDDLPLGVYTSFRTFEHDKFLYLDAHLNRLDESMALLGWTFRIDQGRVCRALAESCRAYPYADARVRVDVLAAPPSRWGLATTGDEGRVLLALAPFTPVPTHCYEQGVAVATASTLKREIPLAKKADFVLVRRAFTEADQRYFERLLLDENGLILEGSSSNFYVVRDGVIWTAGSGALAGVARRIVLQVAGELRVPVELQAWSLADLGAAQEAFLSSSSRGIVPIVRVDEQPVGEGSPGPITRRLMSAYDRHVQDHIQPAEAFLPAVR
jgi:branched-subunit amino acid aminotransferase/4-amino-4-deoxychorismate lyase